MITITIHLSAEDKEILDRLAPLFGPEFGGLGGLVGVVGSLTWGFVV